VVADGVEAPQAANASIAPSSMGNRRPEFIGASSGCRRSRSVLSGLSA
jgi:hypothetical protein